MKPIKSDGYYLVHQQTQTQLTPIFSSATRTSGKITSGTSAVGESMWQLRGNMRKLASAKEICAYWQTGSVLSILTLKYSSCNGAQRKSAFATVFIVGAVSLVFLSS